MDYSGAFSGFSVNDVAAAKTFYADTLGLSIDADESMGLNVALPGGGRLFIYPKDDHLPATYTALNFEVADISAAVDQLTGKGVVFERYDNMPGGHDERGIVRGKAAKMGPDIAWFKDPAGNILAILEQ
jgi:catechol 2,3-dioxygenase-like lactoylglutathione lyase family enzyme